MKKIIPFIFIVLFCSNVYSQNSEKDKFNKVLDKYDRAYDYTDSLDRIYDNIFFFDFNEDKINPYQKALDLYKDVINDFISFSESSANYKDAANYMLANCYSELALFPEIEKSQKIISYDDAKKYIQKAVALRPTLNSITYNEASKVGGNLYTWKYEFSDQVYISNYVYFETKDYENTIKYGEQFIELMKDYFGNDAFSKLANDSTLKGFKNQTRTVFENLSEGYDKITTSDNKKVLKYTVDRIEFLSDVYANNPKRYQKSQDTSAYYRAMADVTNPISDYVISKLILKIYDLTIMLYWGDNNGEMQMRTAKALLKMDRPDKANDFFGYSAKQQKPKLEDAWEFGDIAFDKASMKKSKANSDTLGYYISCLKSAAAAADTNSSSFQLEEWDKLKAYYEVINNYKNDATIQNKINDINNKISEAAKIQKQKERKESNRGKFGIAFSTAPGLLVAWDHYRQIPLCADIKTGHIIHGFRYDMYEKKQDKWHFGNYQKPTNGSDNKNPNIISGFEASYTLKILNKKNNSGKTKIYNGFELRYADYSFHPALADVKQISNNTVTNDRVIDAKANRYEFTYCLGAEATKGFIFFDIYFGFGVGIKKLYLSDDSSGATYDFNSFTVQDDRYLKKRWPMVYVPFRLGFHLGFRIF